MSGKIKMTGDEAFEMGRTCAIPHRGPKNPIQRWMEETIPDATGIPLHPLSKELLVEVIERVPEHVHDHVVRGFIAALLEQVPVPSRGRQDIDDDL